MPTVERLAMPEGYGEATSMMAWTDVQAQLIAAPQYWLATNRHFDGLWVDDVLYYGGLPTTVHVRSALADPRVSIHLPDPWKVVVVEGTVSLANPSTGFAQHLADLANVKYADYGITFDSGSYSDPFALHPQRVRAWSAFPTDATRFTFPNRRGTSGIRE